MQLIELGVLYLLIGGGCAWAVVRRRSAHGVDVALVVFAWPLYLPSLSSPSTPSHEAGTDIEREHASLHEAIDGVTDPSLRQLLPSREQLGSVIDRLRALDAKVRELDTILARDEFDPLRAPPSVRSSVQRLHALRAQAASDRDELLALCTRLRTQITVLRFAGSGTEDVADLVRDIAERIEGVGAALAPGLQSPR